MSEDIEGGAYQWLTTYPNPRAPAYGMDQGQRGWRRHAVKANAKETFGAIADRPAACGLSPAHGWGLDIVADAMNPCARCLRALGFACITCKGKGSIGSIRDNTWTTCPTCSGIRVNASAPPGVRRTIGRR